MTELLSSLPFRTVEQYLEKYNNVLFLGLYQEDIFNQNQKCDNSKELKRSSSSCGVDPTEIDSTDLDSLIIDDNEDEDSFELPIQEHSKKQKCNN